MVIESFSVTASSFPLVGHKVSVRELENKLPLFQFYLTVSLYNCSDRNSNVLLCSFVLIVFN